MGSVEKKNKAFKTVIFIYIAVFYLACIFGAAVPAHCNSYERGSTIYFPKDGDTVSGEFRVNGSVYAKDGIEGARLVLDGGADRRAYDINREKITYKGETLLTLSTFKNAIRAADGTYNIFIELTDSKGVVTEFPAKSITVDAAAPDTSFKMFAIQHLVPLGILTALFITVLSVFKKKADAHVVFAYVCSLLIMTGDIASRIWLISNGTFRASYDIALHMCDISGVMIPLFLFMKPGEFREKIYNLLFIWGLGGALMALLTPEMGGYAFPSYYYFNFFIKHSMIIFGVLIATFFYGMRPKIKYLGWVMAISTAIVAAVYGIDWLVRLMPPFEPGNYMFLSYPPTGGSLIDVLVDIFGPSPYYIIGLEIIGAVIYMLLWLPFFIGSKISKAKKA